MYYKHQEHSGTYLNLYMCYTFTRLLSGDAFTGKSNYTITSVEPFRAKIRTAVEFCHGHGLQYSGTLGTTYEVRYNPT